MKSRYGIIPIIIVLIAILALVPNASASPSLSGNNWTGIDSILDSLGYSFRGNQDYDYIIWDTGITAVAKNNNGTIYEGSDYNDTIQYVLSKYDANVVYIKAGTYTNIGNINYTRSRVRIVGDGMGKTILQADPTIFELVTLRNSQQGWQFIHLQLECQGISICINLNNTGGSKVTRHEFNDIKVKNASILIEGSNSEELNFYHSTIGEGRLNAYGLRINTSGGAVRLYDTLFQYATIANLYYSAGTQLSGHGVSFVGGGSIGQIWINGTAGDRMQFSEIWMEKASGNAIYSNNPNAKLTLDGGIITQNESSTGNNINGTFLRLILTSSPVFVMKDVTATVAGTRENINITGGFFSAANGLHINMGGGINLDNDTSAVTRYYYYKPGGSTIYTNFVFETTGSDGITGSAWNYQSFTNLIPGDFECWVGETVNNPPCGWLHSANGYSQSDVGYIHNHSLQVNGSGTATKNYIKINISDVVRANRSYTLSAWINVSNRTSGNLILDMYSLSDSIDTTGINVTANTFGWQFKTKTYNITQLIPDDLVLRIFTSGTANNGYVGLIDGIILVEGTAVPAYSFKPLEDDGYSIQINSTTNNVTIPNLLTTNLTVSSVRYYGNLTEAPTGTIPFGSEYANYSSKEPFCRHDGTNWRNATGNTDVC